MVIRFGRPFRHILRELCNTGFNPDDHSGQLFNPRFNHLSFLSRSSFKGLEVLGLFVFQFLRSLAILRSSLFRTGMFLLHVLRILLARLDEVGEPPNGVSLGILKLQLLSSFLLTILGLRLPFLHHLFSTQFRVRLHLFTHGQMLLQCFAHVSNE